MGIARSPPPSGRGVGDVWAGAPPGLSRQCGRRALPCRLADSLRRGRLGAPPRKAVAGGTKEEWARRSRAALCPFLLAAARGHAFIGRVSVGATTTKRYVAIIDEIVAFSRQHGHRLISETDVDVVFTNFVNFLFWEGKDRIEGTAAIAAWMRHRPGYSRRGPSALVRVDHALRNWKNIVPGTHPAADAFLFRGVDRPADAGAQLPRGGLWRWR